MLPEHLLPPGLDVRFDLDGGRNFARCWLSGRGYIHSDPTTHVENILGPFVEVLRLAHSDKPVQQELNK